MVTKNRQSHNSTIKDSNSEPPVDSLLNEMLLLKVRKSIETIRAEAKADIDKRIEQLLEEIGHISRSANKEFDNVFKNSPTQEGPVKREKNPGQMPEKHFQARNSLLTDLFGVKHIRTIYHIFVVVMLLTFLNTVVHDYAVDRSINLGLGPFFSAFGKFHIAFTLWLGMQFLSTLLYYAFRCWAKIRSLCTRSSVLTKIWDSICILTFITYDVSFFYVFTKLVLHYDLPHASSVAVLMEITRFTMKTYAFVRANAPKVLRFKEKCDDEKLLVTLPNISWYQYFLFCPTLVYRDHYPRTSRVNWQKVVSYLAEMMMVIMFLSFIFERYAMPYFGKFGVSEVSVQSLIRSGFGCILPGITIFMCGFYSFLHVWMNMWAEMLRFADRMFYQDWWTATDFRVYYRKWNVVVHDWLYTYVYKDLFEHVFIGKRAAAAISVFTISAVFHEIIISISFRFFYPVLFVLFEVFGLLMLFVPLNRWNSAGNIVLWAELCIGNGIQLALYTIEHFARKNCDSVGTAIVDYMVPVSWTCNNITVMNSS